uniref:FAD-dependent oxidoreductase n=1 Tax=Trichocoleus desertorum TaxID=1481672 RepID=UPI0025B31839|nr:FAD-dependent oxidoreductase [Trichocoleus desertorum]
MPLTLEELAADVLVVGGGTGGTVAALQAARRGAKTILVSEFPWLGGMLTSAGVCAPDGNELAAFQTGIWGAFLRELQRRQPGGLDHAWVSFFTYDPRVGAQIFADWVRSLPNLQWISGQTPVEVLRQGDRITGVRFAEVTVKAKVTLDATELGDLLALAGVSYRWGWELQSAWQEPSAPPTANALTQLCPVQSPTWVVILQDFGAGNRAPAIAPPPNYDPAQFAGAWQDYDPEQFLNYGRLPGDRFMLNWPQCGNDYGLGVERLVQSPEAQQEFLQEARWHSQGFAHFIQTQLGDRYGLASDIFPHLPRSLGGGAYALHPYYRESRRLQGLTTVCEQDILPVTGGHVAALPVDDQGEVTAIAIGNYANDHHYPTHFQDQALPSLNLKPKSIRWGGRWTGTPFTIPYGCLVPIALDGLLVCEKNISVSHIANGATRLQPVVMNIGQAAGMAAALCVEQNCEPRALKVRSLQTALLKEPTAPAAIVPLFDSLPQHPDWLHWQSYYLAHPEAYPIQGQCARTEHQPELEIAASLHPESTRSPSIVLSGTFSRDCDQAYTLKSLSSITSLAAGSPASISLVTLCPQVSQQLEQYPDQQPLQVLGRLNLAGNWLLIEQILHFIPSTSPH